MTSMTSMISASPAAGVSHSPATPSGSRNRASGEPQGSSFAQTLERSRQAEAKDAQQQQPGDAAAKPRAGKACAAKDNREGTEPTLTASLAEVLLAASTIAAPPAGPLSQAAPRPALSEASPATATATVTASTAAAAALTDLPTLPPGSAAPIDQDTVQSLAGPGFAAEATLPGAQATGLAESPLPIVAAKQAPSPALAGADEAPLRVAGPAKAASTAVAAQTTTDAAQPLGTGQTAAGKASVPAGMLPAASSSAPAARSDTGTDLRPEAGAADASAPSDAQLAPSVPRPSPQDASAPDGVPFALPPLASAATPGAATQAAAAERPTAVSVAPALGSNEWGPALSHQLIRLGPGGNQVAELNLNPAHLGPLKVTLTVSDNQAQIIFVSAHAAVRQAVEAALPQLRATFADNGLSLGQTSVGAESRQPGQQDDPLGQDRAGRHVAPTNSESVGAAFAEPLAASATTALGRQGSGVDTFA